MMARFIFVVMTAIVMSLRAAADAQFDVQVWLAEDQPDSRAGFKQKLPLGTPTYVPEQSFKSNYHAVWFMQTGCDFMTLAPLRMHSGESSGMDVSDFNRGTNRAAEQFPIPKNIPGVFCRFHSGTNMNVFTLKCDFVYNVREDQNDPVVRKQGFQNTFSFRSNEVAILRLPQNTYVLRPQRTIFGIPAGKGKEVLSRELYFMIQAARVAPLKGADIRE